MTDETDLDRAKIVSFAEKHGFTFRVAYAASDLKAELDVAGIPTYFVFGRDGRLVWSGHSSGASLTKAIETAL